MPTQHFSGFLPYTVTLHLGNELSLSQRVNARTDEDAIYMIQSPGGFVPFLATPKDFPRLLERLFGHAGRAEVVTLHELKDRIREVVAELDVQDARPVVLSLAEVRNITAAFDSGRVSKFYALGLPEVEQRRPVLLAAHPDGYEVVDGNVRLYLADRFGRTVNALVLDVHAAP